MLHLRPMPLFMIGHFVITFDPDGPRLMPCSKVKVMTKYGVLGMFFVGGILSGTRKGNADRWLSPLLRAIMVAWRSSLAGGVGVALGLVGVVGGGCCYSLHGCCFMPEGPRLPSVWTQFLILVLVLVVLAFNLLKKTTNPSSHEHRPCHFV